MRLHTSTLVFAAFLFTACADKTGSARTDTAAVASTPTASAPGAASSDDGDLSDVQSYRLTMDKVDKYLAAQRNLGLRMKSMSPEEREALKARADAESDTDGGESLDAMARRIDAEPALASAVREAGLSTREYAVLTMALVQSSMAAGVLKTRPNENQDSLVREMKANTENVRFIQQNEAELQRKQQALAEEMKRLGVSTND